MMSDELKNILKYFGFVIFLMLLMAGIGLSGIYIIDFNNQFDYETYTDGFIFGLIGCYIAIIIEEIVKSKGWL